MDLLKIINIYRRKITASLFSKPISKYKRSVIIDENYKVKRILIVRPNHRLGNQLLITPLLQDVIAQFPEAEIELFLKGNLGKIIFKNYPEVTKIIALPKKHFRELFSYLKCWFFIYNRKYDLVINPIQNSSSGNIATKITKSKWKFYGIGDDEINEMEAIPDYRHIAKKPVYDFRAELKMSGITAVNTIIPKLNLKLSPEEINQGKIKLREVTDSTKDIICIFTFATDQKCYSKEWWGEMYPKLVEEFKDYTIIEVLPVENVSQIDFAAPSFYSKDVREITSLIANTKLFIGADSGIMHLSAATDTTTVGLFKVTNINTYQPYFNKNTGINTNGLTAEDIISKIKELV